MLAKQTYPIQNQELLIVINYLKDNKTLLIGQSFIVFTNHQALIYWSTKCLLLPRQIHWSDFLSKFNITFAYCLGKKNIITNTLSYKTINSPTMKA